MDSYDTSGGVVYWDLEDLGAARYEEVLNREGGELVDALSALILSLAPGGIQLRIVKRMFGTLMSAEGRLKEEGYRSWVAMRGRIVRETILESEHGNVLTSGAAVTIAIVAMSEEMMLEHEIPVDEATEIVAHMIKRRMKT